jgi:hypothetical protein
MSGQTIGNGPDARPWMRALLVLFSFISYAATAALNDTPIDPNAITDYGTASSVPGSSPTSHTSFTSRHSGTKKPRWPSTCLAWFDGKMIDPVFSPGRAGDSRCQFR